MNKCQVENDVSIKLFNDFRAEVYSFIKNYTIDSYINDPLPNNSRDNPDCRYLNDVQFKLSRLGYTITKSKLRLVFITYKNIVRPYYFYIPYIAIKDPKINKKSFALIPIGVQPHANYIHVNIKRVINYIGSKTNVCWKAIIDVCVKACSYFGDSIPDSTIIYWLNNYINRKAFYSNYTISSRFI